MSTSTLILATLAAGAVGPWVSVGGRDAPPPKALTGEATLPGKVVTERKALTGNWNFYYLQKEAKLESGYEGPLHSLLTLFFNDNGTYQLQYSASWDMKVGALTPLPTLNGTSASRDGVMVTETGRYSLSGEILLLEPADTFHSDIEDNKVSKSRERIKNENRALLLRVDGKRMHIAGRCARYQVEPICRESQDVWFQLTSALGKPRVGVQTR